MICVSIGRSRHRHMMAEHKHLVERGAELVELRLDYISGEVQLKRLLKDRPCPVIVTCRRERDGGKWTGSEDERIMLLKTAIAEGVEYVDLEEDVAADIPRFGKTKRIVSLHDFRKTPDDLSVIYDRLAAKDADIVKLATMANSPHDCLRMLRLIKTSDLPTVGMCMGEMGTPSRILGGRFGAPFTYATFHHERALAPGQLSYEEMTEVYYYDALNRESNVYAVIGDPIGHSFSPLVHNAALREQNINAVYIPFRVPKSHLKRFLTDAPLLGIRGLSVTIPHKENALRVVTRLDRAAREIGAVNTIVFENNGMTGYNTDCRAAMDSLAQVMPKAADEDGLQGVDCLVLGAGGAARAIAYGLKRRGAKITIASRTREKADALGESLDCKSVEWSARHQVAFDVLVNCTPVGMHPDVDESPFERHHLKPSQVVFDTVYNPETTLLVKNARSQSCKVVTGMEMFVRQAALQFKLFTGHTAPIDLMRDTVRRAIGPAKY